MIGHVSFTTIDASDPNLLATFWGQVLGTEVAETADDGRFVFLGEAHGHVLGFQRVPEPKSVKNRVHLDIRVDELQGATDAVLALGGSWDRSEWQLDDTRWRTLTDPEGNEFDVFVSGG